MKKTFQSFSKLLTLLILVVIFMLATACGSDRGRGGDEADADAFQDVGGLQDVQEQSDTDTKPDEAKPGQIALTVLNARESSRYNEQPASGGSRFVFLEINLSNGVNNEPLSPFYEFFSLKTDTGLLIQSSPRSATTTPSCSAQFMLSAGSNYTCELLFEVPHGNVSQTLNYVSADGRTASVEVQVTPCTLCGTECVDLQTDQEHCGQCDNAISSEQTCENSKPQCLTTGLTVCGNDCVDIDVDLDHCGQCNTECLGTCSDGTCKTIQYTHVEVGRTSICALVDDQSLRCWGEDDLEYPFSEGITGSFVQISMNGWHGCGVRPGGAVGCWGYNENHRASPPVGNFAQVYTGTHYTCGIRTDGTIACWADGMPEITDHIPAGIFRQIASSTNTACGLTAHGGIRCWGTNPFFNIPPNDVFTQITTGGGPFYCGLNTEEKIACWGSDEFFGEAPPGTFTQITAATTHLCGIRKVDRHPVCIGSNDHGQLAVPNVAVDQISTGARNTCFIRSSDKKLICVGNNEFGQLNVPGR